MPSSPVIDKFLPAIETATDQRRHRPTHPHAAQNGIGPI